MSGLLSRLAAQAVGKGEPVIHSLARIPYVAPLKLVEETAAPSISGRDAQPQHDPMSDLADTAPPASGKRMIDRHQAPRITKYPTTADVETGNNGRSLSLESAVPEVAALLSPNTFDQHEPRAASMTATPRSDSDREHRDRAPPLGRLGPTQLLPLVFEDAEDAKVWEPRSAEPATSGHVLVPERLPGTLPSDRPRSPSNVPVNPDRVMNSRRTDESDPTEVHVHIGRIEVTAVHEAPAQRAKPAVRRKPLSLDQYLARRKEAKG